MHLQENILVEVAFLARKSNYGFISPQFSFQLFSLNVVMILSLNMYQEIL